MIVARSLWLILATLFVVAYARTPVSVGSTLRRHDSLVRRDASSTCSVNPTLKTNFVTPTDQCHGNVNATIAGTLQKLGGVQGQCTVAWDDEAGSFGATAQLDSFFGDAKVSYVQATNQDTLTATFARGNSTNSTGTVSVGVTSCGDVSIEIAFGCEVQCTQAGGKWTCTTPGAKSSSCVTRPPTLPTSSKLPSTVTPGGSGNSTTGGTSTPPAGSLPPPSNSTPTPPANTTTTPPPSSSTPTPPSNTTTTPPANTTTTTPPPSGSTPTPPTTTTPMPPPSNTTATPPPSNTTTTPPPANVTMPPPANKTTTPPTNTTTTPPTDTTLPPPANTTTTPPTNTTLPPPDNTTTPPTNTTLPPPDNSSPTPTPPDNSTPTPPTKTTPLPPGKMKKHPHPHPKHPKHPDQGKDSYGKRGRAPNA